MSVWFLGDFCRLDASGHDVINILLRFSNSTAGRIISSVLQCLRNIRLPFIKPVWTQLFTCLSLHNRTDPSHNTYYLQKPHKHLCIFSWIPSQDHSGWIERPRGSLQITLLTFTAVRWEEAVSLWGFFFFSHHQWDLYPHHCCWEESINVTGAKGSTAAVCKWNEPFKIWM